jgi:REP element-mobilizing transposase RayT
VLCISQKTNIKQKSLRAGIPARDKTTNNDRMSQRRPVVNGHIMFVTTNIRHCEPLFAHDPYAREAIEVLYRVQGLHLFSLYGFVIMPDHCHFLLRVPPPETIAHIMNVYKSGMTFNIGIPKMWQRRYHIRLIEDAVSALAYIHANPIRKDLAESIESYPWSSGSGKWEVTELGCL